MLQHYRQNIRRAVACRLAAAETLAGPNVFTSRARPILEILQKREAVLSVYTADEASQRDPDGYLMQRTLTVSIEGAIGGGDELDDTLDIMAAQVEAAINTDPTMGSLLTEPMVLTATSSEISARGNQQVGAFRMDFECAYLTELTSLGPEFPLPTEVTINPIPTPQAYVQQLDDARLNAPSIIPKTIDSHVVSPSLPTEPIASACEDGSCDIAAYTGDPQ